MRTVAVRKAGWVTTLDGDVEVERGLVEEEVAQGPADEVDG